MGQVYKNRIANFEKKKKAIELSPKKFLPIYIPSKYVLMPISPHECYLFKFAKFMCEK